MQVEFRLAELNHNTKDTENVDKCEVYRGFREIKGTVDPMSPEKRPCLHCFHACAKEKVRQIKCHEKTTIFLLPGVKWSHTKGTH